MAFPVPPLQARHLGRYGDGDAVPTAYSTSRQSAFTSAISSIEWHRASQSRGEQTRTARHCAREMATLRRLRENRKSRLWGTSSPLEVAIEKETIGACCP